MPRRPSSRHALIAAAAAGLFALAGCQRAGPPGDGSSEGEAGYGDAAYSDEGDAAEYTEDSYSGEAYDEADDGMGAVTDDFEARAAKIDADYERLKGMEGSDIDKEREANRILGDVNRMTRDADTSDGGHR